MDRATFVFCFKILVIAGVGAHYIADRGNGHSRHERPHGRHDNAFQEGESSNESTQNSRESNDGQSFEGRHSIDEILSDVFKNENATGKSGEDFESEKGAKRIELDIILTAEQLALIYPQGRTKRNAIRNVNQLWPGKTLVYSILPEFFTQEETDIILAAMAKWSEYTCLNFREKTSDDADYVKIYNGTGGCYSYVGYINDGGQDLGLASGCVQESVLTHEIGHALGMFHEHTRPDRDQFITVNTENIQPGAESQFEIRDGAIVDNHGTGYDYLSVMHYGRRFFSFNGEDTITTNDPAFQDEIGQVTTFSFLDAFMVNSMYKCADGCNAVNCPSGGYQAKDCKCYCQANDGTSIVLCTEATTTTSTTSTSTTTTQPTTTTSTSTTTTPTTTTYTTSTQPTTTTTTPSTTTTTTSTSATTTPTTTTSTTTTQPTTTTTTPSTTTTTSTTTTIPTTTTSTTTTQPTTTTTTPPTTTSTTTTPTTTTSTTTTSTKVSTTSTLPTSTASATSPTTTPTSITSTASLTTPTTTSSISETPSTLTSTTSSEVTSVSTDISSSDPDSQVVCEDVWYTSRCQWYRWLGRCQSSSYLRSNCEKTCGLCTDDINPPVCADSYPGDICRLIRRYGMCRYYTEHCEKSCGVCQDYWNPNF